MNEIADTFNILPITVIVPTWNERERIEKHISNLSEWIPYVNEVIVVDSNSTDGTLEYIQAHLKHPNLRIEIRPRGLYAAWNHGVRLAQSKYINFATVGDRMSKETVFSLYENAEKFHSEIIISIPRFYDESGALLEKNGPAQRYINHFNISDPHVIPPQRCMAWNLLYFPRTLIGSSASNLYRAEILRRMPFREDVGHVGDSVFAVRQAAISRWLVLPDGDSDFICHGKPDKASTNSRAKSFRDAKNVLENSEPDMIPSALRDKLYQLIVTKKRIQIQKNVMKKMKRNGGRFYCKRLILHCRKNTLVHELERLRHAVMEWK